MSVQEKPRPLPPSATRLSLRADALTAGIAAFALYHLALALFMAAFPRSFYSNVGPFGIRNDHYIRDAATFSAAIGAGLVVALRRPAWRVPMLAITTLQFALHSVNHLVDIGRAHPEWNGYFDFFSLAAATLVLAWLLRTALTTPGAQTTARRRTLDVTTRGAQR
jgi:hypothetical protein